jgi:hypothetical protein
MAIGMATALRNNRLTQIVNAIDAGTGAGKIRIYNGSRPATGGTATTLLAELALSDPCGTVSAGVLTFSAISNDAAADATGTATWARILDSDNNFVMDLNVGTSGADLNFATVSFVANAIIAITSFTITEGNA